MRGNDLISALKRKFQVKTDSALAKKIGITSQGIQSWKKRTNVTERQLSGLVYRASLTGALNVQASALCPIVEFFAINLTESKQGKKYELISTKTSKGGNHAYLYGLRQELEGHFGVYIFFDSRGRAIYAGKARKQSLWKEMNLALNRERGDVQRIRRVNHPARKQPYTANKEKARRISNHVVPLYELAAYFSAYEVIDGMINEVEAMLVRSFANDLLNKRMERFGQQRQKTIQ